MSNDLGISSPGTASISEAKKRQAANRIRGWHHHAIRTKDMVKTRTFYEGLLGLPLTGTWVETFDVVKKTPSNYMHCFFELGDGSALAFFQFEEGAREEPMTMPRDPYEHHIALGVDTVADVKDFKAKLQAAGVEFIEVDHGYCYSVYTTDPNGMVVEVSTIVPNGDVILAEAAATADAQMKAWLAGVKEGNNRWRGHTDLGAD
jgi:catechol 2,3-dioxygenase-like lactoylglutathione lyase family enzyme